MKNDKEVNLLNRERNKDASQEVAAARAGMSVRTARKYEQAKALPSQLKKPRSHRTRQDPFAQDWDWVAALLRDDPALQANTLFDLLRELHPGRYQQGQLRTFQRRFQAWRAKSGPRRPV